MRNPDRACTHNITCIPSPAPSPLHLPLLVSVCVDAEAQGAINKQPWNWMCDVSASANIQNVG